MKKKGFTLVELLAVIAILAILVIIALPNVIGLFQSAQKNSFVNEVREVYRQASNQWLLDGMQAGAEKKYSSKSGCTALQLTGRSVKYNVTVNASGKITKLEVDDTSKYKYSKTDTTGIEITDISATDIADTYAAITEGC